MLYKKSKLAAIAIAVGMVVLGFNASAADSKKPS